MGKLPPDVHAFAGVWSLDRLIDDRLTARQGRFVGEAHITRQTAGYYYDESGVLSFPGQSPMQATRRYLWRPEGQTIAVSFEDGRFFHDFSIANAAPEARHDCAPDLYLVRYDYSWPAWCATWTVSGPRKDYKMVSKYTRNV